MVKIVAIKETANPKVIRVEFEQVMSDFDKARGFGKPKRVWITADAQNSTFKEGQIHAMKIKMIAHDEPQYEGHLVFEQTGKYYTSQLTE